MWSVRSDTAWTYGPLRSSPTCRASPPAPGHARPCRRCCARVDVDVADARRGADAVDPPDQLPGPRVDDRVVERLAIPPARARASRAGRRRRRGSGRATPRRCGGSASAGRRRCRPSPAAPARRPASRPRTRAARRSPAWTSRRRARRAGPGHVDQPPVVADRGLQAAVDVRDPARLLLPAQVRGPVLPGRAGRLAEAGEVRLLQPEGGAVLCDVGERDVGGVARARRREEAVEAGDELRRSGVRVGLHQAVRAERVAELRLGALDLRRRPRGGRGEVDRRVDGVRRTRRRGASGQQCERSRQRAREGAWRCELRLQDVCSLTDRGAGPWSRVVRAPPRHHTGK